VHGGIDIGELGIGTAGVTGTIQYSAPSLGVTAMHSTFKVSVGFALTLESWIHTTGLGQPTQFATKGNIEGIDGCQRISLPPEAITCGEWRDGNGATVMVRGKKCIRNQRDCVVALSEEMLDENPGLSALVGTVTITIYTTGAEPVLIQSNVTSTTDGEQFETVLSLYVTDAKTVPPPGTSVEIPTDCV